MSVSRHIKCSDFDISGCRNSQVFGSEISADASRGLSSTEVFSLSSDRRYLTLGLTVTILSWPIWKLGDRNKLAKLKHFAILPKGISFFCVASI